MILLPSLLSYTSIVKAD